MRILIRIAVALLLALSFFGSSVQAVDLPTPAVTCVIGDFVVPNSLVASNRVSKFHYDDYLVKNIEVSDEVLALIKDCHKKGLPPGPQLRTNAAGVHEYMPLPYLGEKPLARDVQIIACTDNGVYLFKKRIAPSADFTFTFGPGNKIAKSNPLSKRC